MSLNRINNDVEPVETFPLDDHDLFIYSTGSEGSAYTSSMIIAINLPLLREHFRREGRLSTFQLMTILNLGIEILSKEPNLLELSLPITSNSLLFTF
jgi:hypothetical protein